MANKINVQIGFSADKSGLNDIYNILKNIQIEANKAGSLGTLTDELSQASIEAKKLESILNSAWNSKLNQWDLSKVNQSITKTYGSIDQMKTKLESLGQGNVFNKLQSELLSTNLQLKQSNKLLDDMATTFANTVRFGISSSVFNRITNEIQKAYEYSVKLDTSLNEIRIVSNKSADDMERFAVQANKAAKALGSSTLDYTQASTIYYQQGLSDAETAARTEVTLKAANVTAQTGEDVSEQLTAIWNGYKVSAEETELYIDKVAKVAANTAADLEEMATGMSKVASAANSAGVDIDQLNATLATVISVTREAPETVGSAFKTIYARMGDLALDGEDEYGVTLGNVSSKLHELGIEILDEQGNMRDMGDVIEDTAEKWQTWTQAQKQAAAVAMAGKMQYSRLIALFDSWDMYTQALEDSQNAVGTLQEQQDIYMESTEAHLQQLKTEAERTYDTLFNMDTVNDFSDALTNVLSIFNNFLDTTGGGLSSLTNIGLMLGNIFSKQIGSGIGQMLNNRDINTLNEQNAQAALNLAQQGVSQAGSQNEIEVYEREIEYSERLLALSKELSTERYNELNTLKHNLAQDELRVAAIYDYEEATKDNNQTLSSITTKLNAQKQHTQTIQKEATKLVPIFKQLQLYINEGYETQDDINNALDLQVDILDAAERLMKQQLLDKKESLVVQKMLKDFENDELSEQDTLKLQETINQALERQLNIEKDIRYEQEMQQAIESGETEKLEKRIKQEESQLKQGLSGEERIATVQQTVQGITALVSITQQFVGIVKTLNDDSLTGWEKFVNIGSTLLFTLPMLISNLSSINAILPITATVGTTAGEGISLGFNTAKVSVLGFKLATWELWIILAAIGVVIVALVASISALSNAYNADANAAKEAAQASKDAATAAEEAKDAYEELKDSVTAYDDAVDAMKDLTYGTQEYTDALKEANDAAMELMKNNPELISKAQRNAQGLIEFEGIDTETLLQQSLKNVNIAEGAANIAQTQANTASLKSQRTEFIRSNNMDWWWDLKAFFTGDALNDDQLQKIIEVINTTGGLTESDLKSIVGSNKSLINTLMETDNREELIELANNTKLLNDTNQLLLDEALRTSLENNTTYAGMTDAEKNAVAEIYGEGLTEERKADIEQKARDKWYQDAAAIFGGGNEDVVHSEYAAVRGWTLSEDKLGDKAIYVDSEGNEHEITDDAARAYLVQRDISEQIGKYDEETLDKMMSGIQKISKVGAEVSSDIETELLGFVTGKDTTFDATQVTQDQIDKLKQKIQSGELLNDLKDVTDEEWTSMGISNAEEYISKIQEGIENYKPNWDLEYQTNAKYAQQSQDVLNILSKGDESDLDDDQLNYLKQLESEYEELGKIQDRTSHEYLQTLREIKEQQETNAATALKNSKKQQEEDLQTNIEKLDQLKEQYDTEQDEAKKNKLEIEIVAKTEEVEEALEKLQDTNYQITVQIDTDLASDVEDAFGLANELEQLQNAVSDDLTYTFEEAQELIAKGYGEIFTNAKETAENTIQVNKDVLNSFIDNKQAEIEADKNAKIDQLENQKILLQAQKDALQNKLSALQEAASAETAVDAATAMEKVNNANLEYEAATEALNQSLQDEADGATENQNINAELYNALGGMYEQDAKNEEQAEEDATNNQQANIQARINNVHQLHQAYSNLARQIAASESGEVIKVGDESASSGGVSLGITGSTNIESTSQTANQIDITDLKQKTQDLFNNNKAQYDATIQSLIKSTQAEINSIEAQIGAADAGIAALKSASNSLDKAQRDAKIGGSGSDKEPDKEDYLENEKDRYHDINIELEQISNELDRIQKQKDKLFGQDLIDNLNKQLTLLNKQIDKTNEKINIAKGEALELRSALAQKGVTFNSDGTIANYSAVYDAQLAYVNSLITQYNNMSSEAQESFKDTLEAAKDSFDKFVDDINNYDTLITETIPELENDIQDAIDEKIELQIEKFNMEIEIRLDLAEAERDWNEFKRKVIDQIKDDDILGNARAKLQDFYSYYKDDETGIIQRNTTHVEDILSQLKQMDETGWSDVYGDNRAQALEDLQTYYQQLMSDLKDIEDLQEEIHDAYIDMIDEAQEKFDEQLDTYEQISSLIEHDIKLIQLLNGEDNSYKELVQYYEKQEENYNKQLDFQRQQVDFWRQQMELAEEGSEEWQAAKENWMDAVEDWRSSVEDAVDNITDKYINAINLIFEKLNDKVTNGAGLDYISEEWDLINQNAEQYLDTINSMYGIQSLQNKYLDAIDQTDNIAAQRKLNALMQEELAALEQKDKLTQYDIDRANMKYEIALKQIALEEAQQNKSTMRLRRDSQGNYSYQFVTDEDEIGTLKDELADLYNQLYNFDLDRYKDNLDQIYSAWEEYQEKMAEAAQINDPEKRAERELLLNEQYGELINGLVEQNETIRLNLHESAFTELADLYNTDLANFQQLTQDEQDILLNDMIPQWSSGVQQMADVFAGEGGFANVCKEAMEELKQATEDYEDSLNDTLDIAGIVFDDIANGTDNTIIQTEDLLWKNDELIESYGDQLQAIRDIIAELGSLITKYNAARDAALAASEAAFKYWQEQEREAAAVAAKENAQSSSSNTNSTNNTNASNSSSSTSGYGNGDGVLRVGDVCTYTGGTYYYDSYGTSPSGNRGPGKQVTVTQVKEDGRPYPIHVQSKDSAYGWLKKSQLSGYDTGGYTGNWGDNSGKLALLHKKELVLNSDDTPNMLNAVYALRGIIDTVGSSMLSRLAQLGSGINAPTGAIAASTDTIEQNVHIDATFPGVQNAKEIEDALNNLVNRASQRTYRKKN